MNAWMKKKTSKRLSLDDWRAFLSFTYFDFNCLIISVQQTNDHLGTKWSRNDHNKWIICQCFCVCLLANLFIFEWFHRLKFASWFFVALEPKKKNVNHLSDHFSFDFKINNLIRFFFRCNIKLRVNISVVELKTIWNWDWNWRSEI